MHSVSSVCEESPREPLPAANPQIMSLFRPRHAPFRSAAGRHRFGGGLRRRRAAASHGRDFTAGSAGNSLKDGHPSSEPLAHGAGAVPLGPRRGRVFFSQCAWSEWCLPPPACSGVSQLAQSGVEFAGRVRSNEARADDLADVFAVLPLQPRSSSHQQRARLCCGCAAQSPVSTFVCASVWVLRRACATCRLLLQRLPGCSQALPI